MIRTSSTEMVVQARVRLKLAMNVFDPHLNVISYARTEFKNHGKNVMTGTHKMGMDALLIAGMRQDRVMVANRLFTFILVKIKLLMRVLIARIFGENSVSTGPICHGCLLFKV